MKRAAVDGKNRICRYLPRGWRLSAWRDPRFASTRPTTRVPPGPGDKLFRDRRQGTGMQPKAAMRIVPATCVLATIPKQTFQTLLYSWCTDTYATTIQNSHRYVDRAGGFSAPPTWTRNMDKNSS